MATNPYDANLGMGGAPSNPYLGAQAGAIANTATRNLQNNILPGIDSGAMAAGGYGGSRQGIAQANAIGQTNQDISNATANLYGNAYGQDLQYNLGLGSLANNAQATQNNFYTQQRGLDQSGLQLGANLTNSANAGYVGQGSALQGLGTTEQQAPWQSLQNAGNVYSQFSGLGGTQTQTQNGSALGAISGLGLAGAQLIGNLGLGSGSSSTTNPYALASTYDPSGQYQNLPDYLRVPVRG
jgi:hypothetical protein